MTRSVLTVRPITDERGVTLVETMIYALLSVVVLSVAGSMLITSLDTQRDVSSITEAASVGQVISTDVANGIRNSSAFQVETPTALGQTLRSRSVSVTSAGVTEWRCQAWYLAASGTFYATSSTAGAVPQPTAAADLAGWRLLGESIAVPAGAGQAFTGSGGQLVLAIEVGAGTAKPTLINTTIAARPQSNTGTVPTTCF
ncbi:hypothetical protein BH09ACT3_BH09ACT3_06750 [soil metagenome]